MLRFGIPLEAALLPPRSPAEVRCAVRFPLMLPVVLVSSQGVGALTRNVSASGVFAGVGSTIGVGLESVFSLRMPG